MNSRLMLLPLLALGLNACVIAQEPAAPVAVVVAEPAPAPKPRVFPAANWDMATAQENLADDFSALRFLTLRELEQLDALPETDIATRRNVNLGALLPLSTPAAPAKGLDRPYPLPSDVVAYYQSLPAAGPQQIFVLENTLPIAPQSFERFAPKDKVGSRAAEQRLGRLQQAGLINEAEANAEKEALASLAAVLPEVFTPPAPPAKPKPRGKGNGNAATGKGSPTQRLQGGVSGQLVIAPSPKEIEAAPLPADSKGPAGLHVLSMGQADQGERAMTALRAKFPDLANMNFRVERADLGDLGVTHRLIVGPVESPDKARALCSQLKAAGQSCTPTPF